ncbi:hypothetical protein OPT61_g215 [Boeremia exigua]|uniref:Uncharacterized protein n=1 Tax=Boeremia exigua TaxID=749465 RepID=A0ACC2IUK5_9PLEO|nr:hypothetical protein OPT61_g215 [Boeremia exigua]
MPFLSDEPVPSTKCTRPDTSVISEREIDKPRALKVIYIGAGVSGIVGAIQFRKLVPDLELVIYEKNSGVGGTWYENKYPGCACDVPSLSYQLSFESSTHWSQFYASAPEILAYWENVASKYDIHRHIRYEHRCVEARWQPEKSKWAVTLLKRVDNGASEVVHDSADVLVTGTGTLNEWKWPEIAGIETFQGTLLHSAKWDESFSPTGKAVAVVGGGSSGIQIVPALAPKVTRMDHYIRGKTWIANQIAEHHVTERQDEASNGNFSYSQEERQGWLNDPSSYLRYRKDLELSLQGFYATCERDNPRCVGIEERFAKIMKKRLNGKPELLNSLIPNYPPLCKRLTPGPGYLEALASPTVDVITSPIKCIDATGIITTDGRHRPVDAIICATGFDTSVSSGFPIFGKDGQNLREKYNIYPRTYLGLCTDGFPNFFQSLGPNSFQGAGSLLLVIESIHSYIAQVLERLSTGNVKTIEPKSRPVDRFTAYCDEYFKRTVYTADCLSWYKTAPPGSSTEQRMRGRVTALWPGSSVHAMKALKSVRWEDFEMEHLDGNDFGWFGDGWTVADRSGDPEVSESSSFTEVVEVNCSAIFRYAAPDWTTATNTSNRGRGHVASLLAKLTSFSAVRGCTPTPDVIFAGNYDLVQCNTHDEDVIVIGRDDISNYNPAQVLPESPEQIKKIRSWLQATDYAHASGEYRKHLASHMSGTGSWLTSSATYKQWLSVPDNTTLWIKGIPGAGKSVVAAHLIDCLTQSHPGQPVLYFFFRQIIDANHQPQALLRDWLHQILEFSPPLQKELKELIDNNRTLQSLSMEDLWSYLRLATQDLPGSAFCVADALDEMDQGNEEFVQSLAIFGTHMQGKAKVIITSRPTPAIESSLRASTVLRLRLEEDMVDADISSYIETGLRTSELSKADQDLVRRAIPGQANGIFLYAKLAMDAFLEPDINVEAVLQALPTDLHAMYTKLLQQHADRSGVSQSVQLLIFQWVTHATRPLRLLELAEVIRISHPPDHSSSAAMDIKAAKDLIRAAAGPLLEILPNETVCVIHHSFTEYLKCTTRCEDDGGYPILRFEATHGRLALACVEYLRAGCLDSIDNTLAEEDGDPDLSELDEGAQDFGFFGGRSPPTNDDQQARLQHPFYAYAAAHWHLHVKRSSSTGFPQDHINVALDRFFSNTNHTKAWLRHHWEGKDASSRRVTPLHIAARFGLGDFVRHLCLSESDMNAVDILGRTPLWWAASAGHADVMRCLLQAGAKPDIDEKVRGLKPLHEAASNNHGDAVRVLLEAGVDPLTPKANEDPGRWCGNAPRTQGYTPLMYACKNGHLEALEAFLPFLTDINIVHRALAWSAESGRPKLVQGLLRYPGIDANAKVRGDTILFRACKQLDRDSIIALLEAGADPMISSINQRDEFAGFGGVCFGRPVTEDRGHTALHGLCGVHQRGYAAAERVDASVLQEICESLLAKGVDVNFRTPDGRTALHTAVHNPILAKILLHAGADVDAVDDNGRTPLHGVSLPETIALLLEAHANINYITPSDGKSPLLRLLTGHSSDAVLKLLDYHPDMTIKGADGKGPLHLALSLLRKGAPLIKALLEAGADPDERNNSGDPPLLAVRMDSHETMAVIDVLLDFGADINARDRAGASTLTKLVRQPLYNNGSDHKEIRDLLVRGADLHIRDHRGRSLLHHAVSAHDLRAFTSPKTQNSTRLDLLLSLGLDIECTDYRGNTLLHELAVRPDMMDPFYRDAAIVFWKQLLDRGLDVDKCNHRGRTVLHVLVAAQFCRDGSWSSSKVSKAGSFGPLDFIISKSRDINHRDLDGLTALHLASTVSECTTKKLLDAGADPHWKTNEGLTALHLAARARQSNVVGLLSERFLIDDPKSVDVQDAKKRTPLYYACRSGVPETVRLLVDAGADATNSSLWQACAEFDEEQRLWSQDRHLADTEVNGQAGGLTIDDNTRPGLSPNVNRQQNDPLDDTTRLEEILQMLLENNCDLKGLVGDVGAIFTAAKSGSEYTMGCLTRARDRVGAGGYCKRFLKRVIEVKQAALKTVVKEEVNGRASEYLAWLVKDLLKTRQYEALSSMSEAGFNFLDEQSVHLELLVRYGYSALLDTIGTVEAQRHLEEGRWHAFRNKSKPGLYNGSHPNAMLRESLLSRSTFFLLVAVQRGAPNMDAVRLLVEKFHVDVNDYCYRAHNNHEMVQQHTALHELARSGHWWQVALAIPYLISKGANASAKDDGGRTPLHIALGGTKGEVGPFYREAVRILLASGANVDELDNEGVSCLSIATGDLEMVNLLLQKKAKITAGAVLKALQSQQEDVLQALLDAGADPNGRLEGSVGSDPLPNRPKQPKPERDVPVTEEYPLYCIATEHGAHTHYLSRDEKLKRFSDTAKLMQTLLSAGADPLATFHRWTSNDAELKDSVLGEDEAVKELLRDGRVAGVVLEEVTLVHNLLDQNSMVHPILMMENLDADRRDADGRNLLHMACHHHNPDAPIDSLIASISTEQKPSMSSFLDCLCARGADPLAIDASGNNILHHMFLSNKQRKSNDNDRSVIERLANLYPSLVNQKNSRGKPPLHMALKHATLHNTVAAAEALLELGADAFASDNDGNTALHILAFSLYESAKVRDLFANLLQCGLDVNARNQRGESPMFNLNKRLISRSGDLRHERVSAAEALAIFERAGADLFIQDYSGKTLLHVAAKETQEPVKNDPFRDFRHKDPNVKPLEPSIARFQTLMSKGLDPFAEDECKRTALDVAAACGKESVLKLFENQNSQGGLPTLGATTHDDSDDIA